MEELLVLKNCFDSKIDWLEKLFVLKTYLDSKKWFDEKKKINWKKKLIQNSIGWTICLY